jgi:hypothetical protein
MVALQAPLPAWRQHDRRDERRPGLYPCPRKHAALLQDYESANIAWGVLDNHEVELAAKTSLQLSDEAT